ncbi:hypothetical protein [Pontimicrobium sp. IMCC45349]|uniref:hypothetical protein n=1 Tax=Pontimicrobium sp. IMCC45349 TaxID=3391574 RepID=UPI0039A1110F
MQKHKYILLVAFIVGFVTLSHSQHRRYAIKNGIGIQGGITQFDIITDNFETTASSGWIGGLNATVDLPHKWYTVSYSMLLSENNLEILGRMTDDVAGNEALEYKLMTVQVGFTFHTKIISDNLTIDIGPQLQYNGKMDLTNSTQESFYVNGYDNVLATDISEISQFNVNGMVGASLGFGAFKVRAQYIYGFTNMLNKLNDAEFAKGLNTKFKGNQSMIAVTAMLTF